MKHIMELMIAEKIRKFRREKDVTQEQMAQAIGVSAQSVSKWECGDGYPDITLLPAIANYFGVSVDALLGTDEIGVEEDKRAFFRRTFPRDSEERIEFDLEYSHKYPKDYHIASALAGDISRLEDEALRDKYLPQLREACEKIMQECTDSALRRTAVKIMCKVCGDDELNKWINADTTFWHAERSFIHEERHTYRKDFEKAEAYHAANNAVMINRLLNHMEKLPQHYRGKPERSVELNSQRMRLIEAVGAGENGEVADGWLGEYAIALQRLAAGYCGNGQTEEGLVLLERALAVHRRLAALPSDMPRSLGNPGLFGETAVVCYGEDIAKDGQRQVDFANATWHYLYGPGETHVLLIPHLRQSNDLYRVLTAKKGWEWFDCVRDDSRYLALVEAARELYPPKEE